MVSSAKGAKNWLRRESSRSTQTRSAPHRLRGTPPFGDQVRVEPVEQRAAERLALEPLEHRGQQLEVRSVPGHRPVGVPHMPPQPPADHALDGQRGERQDRRRPADRPRRDDGQERHRGDGGRAEAKPRRSAGCAGVARRGERVAADRRRHLLAEDGQVLPEIEARRQRLHGLLPRAHRRGIRRRQQPGGERLLAHARPRGAEQLEQRALAEEVEVAGIRMVGVAEARSGAAGARPLPVEAREPSPVVRGAPLGPETAPADPRVNDEQGRERRGGRHEPPRRQPAGAEGQPRDQRRPPARRPRRAREILSSSRAASATRSWCRDSRRWYSSRGVAAVNRRPYTLVTASAADRAPITWP